MFNSLVSTLAIGFPLYSLSGSSYSNTLRIYNLPFFFFRFILCTRIDSIIFRVIASCYRICIVAVRHVLINKWSLQVSISLASFRCLKECILLLPLLFPFPRQPLDQLLLIIMSLLSMLDHPMMSMVSIPFHIFKGKLLNKQNNCNDSVAAVAVPPLSMASSSGPSPSSSQQPSPSPSGAKYENTRELKQLRDKIEAFGNKGTLLLSGFNIISL